MIRKPLLILALAAMLLPAACFGQSIKGKQQAEVGSLVVLEPIDVEDARTTWILNAPVYFAELAEENKKLFLAMPNEPVVLTLLVIPNDVSKDIQKIRHLIEPVGDGDDGGDGEDPGDGGPGDGDPGNGLPAFQAQVESFFKNVIELSMEPQKAKDVAKMLAARYRQAVGLPEYTAAKSVEEANEIVRAYREDALLSLGELLDDWAPALQSTGNLISEKPPTTVKEYTEYLLAISRALENAAK